VEEPGHVHLFVNEGDTDLELVAFQLLPFGAKRRVDEPAPQEHGDVASVPAATPAVAAARFSGVTRSPARHSRIPAGEGIAARAC